MRVITFKAEEDLIVLLDAYAMSHGLSRSEVIRIAIEKLVKEEEMNKGIKKAKVERISLR